MLPTYSHIRQLATSSILLLLFSHVNAAGYHYDPPAPPPHSTLNTNSGHYFGPIPTTAPLPSVPALPQLPTAPTRTNTQVQTLVQVHSASQGALRPQGPPLPSPPQRPPNYRPGPYNAFGNYLRPGFPSGNVGAGRQPVTQLYLKNDPTPSQPQLIGFHYTPSTGATPQPFRAPYGKQPFYNYATGPDNEFYVVNGRQLKQYAVVEVVDNDISQDTKPFLTQSFVNNYRAHVGASGTGAIAPLPSAMQLDSAANAILREQQRLTQQGAVRRGDTIALGSGGIGYVRLSDGTVSLGSGSLNFVTARQHLEDLRNARTRSELQRDPLHFGHGPLEDVNNKFLFK